MIYEFRTYTLKPRSLAEVEKRFGEGPAPVHPIQDVDGDRPGVVSQLAVPLHPGGCSMRIIRRQGDEGRKKGSEEERNGKKMLFPSALLLFITS